MQIIKDLQVIQVRDQLIIIAYNINKKRSKFELKKYETLYSELTRFLLLYYASDYGDKSNKSVKRGMRKSR
jgi:hypothetical protein